MRNTSAIASPLPSSMRGRPAPAPRSMVCSPPSACGAAAAGAGRAAPPAHSRANTLRHRVAECRDLGFESARQPTRIGMKNAACGLACFFPSATTNCSAIAIADCARILLASCIRGFNSSARFPTNQNTVRTRTDSNNFPSWIFVLQIYEFTVCINLINMYSFNYVPILGSMFFASLMMLEIS